MAEQKNNFIGFVGPAYSGRSKRFDCQRLVNMYLEVDQTQAGKGGEQAVMISTPGLEFFKTVGAGPIRAVYVQSNAEVMFVVSGNRLYKLIDLDSDPELITGTLLTSTGTVQIADNGVSLMMVDGQYGYYCDMTSGSLTRISSPNFHPSDTITFQDGYFILVQNGTQGFFLSNINDVTFPTLNEAYKSGSPDNLVAAISVNRQLYLLGERTTEIWYNQGSSASTPFIRQDGRATLVGCAAPYSVAVLGESFIFLGRNAQGGGIVYSFDAGTPARISNHAVEYAIQNLGDLSGATAYAYQQEGHYFYCLNIPGSSTTWVYDVALSQWHERQSILLGLDDRHLGENHCIFNTRHVIGDYSSGNLYFYNLDVYTDNGQVVNRIRQAPHVSANLNRIFFKLLEVDMQFGVGLSSGQGSNPKITLQMSNDGGETWGNPINATMGKIGKYNTRARWSRLGSSRDRVFRVIVTEPVRCTILSAKLDIEIGTS